METKYYRKAGTCRRLVTATCFNFITLPPESVVALRGEQVFQTPALMEEAMKGFEEVTAEEWKSFYFTFLQSVTAERQRQIESTTQLHTTQQLRT
jgi:hypothetical protein